MKYALACLVTVVAFLALAAAVQAQSQPACDPTDPKCLLSIQGTERILPTSPGYIAPVSTEQISGRELVKRITQFLLGFVGAIALLMLVIGGYMYITARGEEAQTEKAKQVIFGVVIGIIIILGAWTLVITVLNFSEMRTGNIITGQQNP